MARKFIKKEKPKVIDGQDLLLTVDQLLNSILIQAGKRFIKMRSWLNLRYR